MTATWFGLLLVLAAVAWILGGYRPVAAFYCWANPFRWLALWERKRWQPPPGRSVPTRLSRRKTYERKAARIESWAPGIFRWVWGGTLLMMGVLAVVQGVAG